MPPLETDLKLRPADYESVTDLAFLYGVLALRLGEPDSNISHRILPSWTDHVAYLQSDIYRGHYLAVLGNRGGFCLGHCYLDKHGNVGVYVHRGFREHGVGRWMLSELISRHPPPVWANVNPKNVASLRLFRNMGFIVSDASNPFQTTLRLEGALARIGKPLESA